MICATYRVYLFCEEQAFKMNNRVGFYSRSFTSVYIMRDDAASPVEPDNLTVSDPTYIGKTYCLANDEQELKNEKIQRAMMSRGQYIAYIINNNSQVLIDAIENNYRKVVKYLLSFIDLKTHKDKIRVLAIAAKFDYQEILELLLSQGLNQDDIKSKNNLVLHIALRYGKIDTVLYLLCKMNAEPQDVCIALHHFVKKGDTKSVRILLNFGVTPDLL